MIRTTTLIALALSAIAAPVAAQDAQSVTVHVADLDLSTATGQAALHRRISYAAAGVCQPPLPDDLGMRRLSKVCQRNAMAAAMASIDSRKTVNLAAR